MDMELTLTILPSGPLPFTLPNGTPLSNAIFLANGLAKNFGLSPPPLSLGLFCPSVPAFPDPYFFSSAGVPNAGVTSLEADSEDEV